MEEMYVVKCPYCNKKHVFPIVQNFNKIRCKCYKVITIVKYDDIVVIDNRYSSKINKC